MLKASKKNMQFLIKELNKASRLYYGGKESELSDKRWDTLYDNLEKIETELGFKYKCSPTKNVGYPPDDSFLEEDVVR